MVLDAINTSVFMFNYMFNEDLRALEMINIENKQLLWLLMRRLSLL